MKRLVLLVALAGCSEPATTPDARPTATPPPIATTSRAIGTTSNLSADTSPLTGAVSAFQVSVSATETTVSLAADTLFAFDSATLDPGATANLTRTADLVRKGGAGDIRIVGHTDAKGDDSYNLALSTRRAEAVATWLRTQQGLAGRTISVGGRGEAEPVAPNAKPDGNDDPDGRARNRRVVVVIPR